MPGDKSWGSGNASPPLECRGEVPEVVWGRSSQKLTTSWYRSLSTRLQHCANCWITLKALYKHASCRTSTLKSFTFSNWRRTNVNLNNKKHKPTACYAAAFCLYSIVDCCVAFPVAITLFTIIDVTSWLVSHTIRYDTIRDAILTCARKPTWVSSIYRTEPTTKKCKNRKSKK